MLLIQVSLCYILKHLEDGKVWYVHIYYTWCDIILIFKVHRRTRLTPRSSTHSLKIRMTSHLCNKYEHTTLSYLLSVKHISDHGVIPCGISDHDVIFAIRSMKVPKHKKYPQTVSTRKLNVLMK